MSRAEYLFVQCPRGRKSFEKFPNCLLCQIWIIRYRKQSWPETTLNRFGHIDPCDRVDNKEGGGNKGDHSNEIMNGVFKFHFTLPTCRSAGAGLPGDRLGRLVLRSSSPQALLVLGLLTFGSQIDNSRLHDGAIK